MAWHFDEVDDYVTIDDHAALTLPAGDWSIGGWFKLTDNIGWYYQYIFSCGTSNFYGFYVTESHGAGSPHELEFWVSEELSANAVTTNTNPGSHTNWQHVLAVKNGTTLRQYSDGSLNGSTTATVGEVDPDTDLCFGSSYDQNVNRFFGGSMAEWASWDRALSTDEIAALAAGYSPACFPLDRKWYVPMVRDYVERDKALTVTNNGSIVVDHPPIIYPGHPQPGPSAATPVAGLPWHLFMGSAV